MEIDLQSCKKNFAGIGFTKAKRLLKYLGNVYELPEALRLALNIETQFIAQSTSYHFVASIANYKKLQAIKELCDFCDMTKKLARKPEEKVFDYGIVSIDNKYDKIFFDILDYGCLSWTYKKTKGFDFKSWAGPEPKVLNNYLTIEEETVRCLFPKPTEAVSGDKTMTE